MADSSEYIVLDTDIVSYLFKGDTRASLYRKDLVGKLPIISFMTVAELKFWAVNKNWGEKRTAAMEEHLRHFLIYPVDMKLIDNWARITAKGKSIGRIPSLPLMPGLLQQPFLKMLH